MGARVYGVKNERGGLDLSKCEGGGCMRANLKGRGGSREGVC